MPLYKPSELMRFLSEIGASPKKGLSQNFLIDGNIIRKIVAAAKVVPGDVVLEIGPGPGALTEALLEAGAKVVAVEKDPVLASALGRFQNKNLDVHCADIQKFPIEDVFEGKRIKVIANLPYHITTPIITSLVPLRHLIDSLVVMVQDEVARRFVAKPGTKDYGSLTVFLSYYTDPSYAFQVSKNCFYPVPKVDSAVAILKLKEPPKVSDEEGFFLMTRTAFEQRRKMLRSSLRKLYGPEAVEQALIVVGHSPQARPEELSLEDLLRLYTYLNSSE